MGQCRGKTKNPAAVSHPWCRYDEVTVVEFIKQAFYVGTWVFPLQQTFCDTGPRRRADCIDTRSVYRDTGMRKQTEKGTPSCARQFVSNKASCG